MIGKECGMMIKMKKRGKNNRKVKRERESSKEREKEEWNEDRVEKEGMKMKERNNKFSKKEGQKKEGRMKERMNERMDRRNGKDGNPTIHFLHPKPSPQSSFSTLLFPALRLRVGRNQKVLNRIQFSIPSGVL